MVSSTELQSADRAQAISDSYYAAMEHLQEACAALMAIDELMKSENEASLKRSELQAPLGGITLVASNIATKGHDWTGYAAARRSH